MENLKLISCVEWHEILRRGVQFVEVPKPVVDYIMGRYKHAKRFPLSDGSRLRYHESIISKAEYEEYDTSVLVNGANNKDAIDTDDLLSLAMDVTGLSKEELLKKPEPTEEDNGKGDDDDDSSSEGWSDFEEDDNEEEDRMIREWGASVDAAIKALGGSVFPKLNWSAPKDAVWSTSNGNLRCRSHSDVLRLLKNSDYAAADINQAEDIGMKVVLVLKPWREVSTGSEFRCFVMKRKLVSICQRHQQDCYEFTAQSRHEIEFALDNYINASIVPFIPPSLNDFVVDVSMENINRISLIDMDVLTGDEDYLLISYPELVTISNAMELDKTLKAELRTTDPSVGVQPSARNLYGVPVELRDATSLEDIINMMQRADYKAKQEKEAKEKEKKEKEEKK